MADQLSFFDTTDESEEAPPVAKRADLPSEYGLDFNPQHKATMGDLWRIDDHRLLVGDSGKLSNMGILCGKETIQLVHSDPPYNVCVQPEGDWGGNTEERGRKKADGKTAKSRKLVGDFLSTMEFGKRLSWWFRCMESVLDKGRSFYIWGGFSNLENYPPAIKSAFLHWHQIIIWVKNMKVLTRLDFMGQSEIAFYGWKARKGEERRFFAGEYIGEKKPPDVWSIDCVPRQQMIHLTEKPVEIPRRAIEYSSEKGENVLDLFGGSGSTLVAAAALGRRAFLMEYDETYATVILARCNNLGMEIKKLN